jgi:hypothetical protein
MEITEIISYYVLDSVQLIEVSFRTTLDGDDEFRTDSFSINLAKEYGYEIIEPDYDFYDDDDEDDFDNFITVNEEALVEFLNEYYIVNPNKLPKQDLL